MSYGFGYDEEVPAGFQDADLEMRELAELAAERQANEANVLKTRIVEAAAVDPATGERHELGERVGALIAEAFRLTDAGRPVAAGACFAEADLLIERHELTASETGPVRR